MYTLTIEYYIGTTLYQQTIEAFRQTRTKGKVIIGRDSKTCDIVISDPTNRVSRTHIQIDFDPYTFVFTLTNLTAHSHKKNIAFVDGKQILNQTIEIRKGSTIQLGTIVIKVTELRSINSAKPHDIVYGLLCPRGHKVPLGYANTNCPHCGCSLQASKTIVL